MARLRPAANERADAGYPLSGLLPSDVMEVGGSVSMSAKRALAPTLVLAIFLSAFLLTSLSCVASIAKDGSPYKVVTHQGKFEVRSYKPRLVASVEIQGCYEKAINTAFGVLAGYIFAKPMGEGNFYLFNPYTSDNKAREKLPMASPVFVEPSPKSLTMRFLMPDKYTVDTLPAPEDERVKFSVIPAQHYVVIRFSGTGRAQDFNQRAEELKEYAKNNNLKMIGGPISAYYNPPITPPIFRRNEVHIPIQYEPPAPTVSSSLK